MQAENSNFFFDVLVSGGCMQNVFWLMVGQG